MYKKGSTEWYCKMAESLEAYTVYFMLQRESLFYSTQQKMIDEICNEYKIVKSKIS